MSFKGHAIFIDGPLAGKSLNAPSTPIMLRVAINDRGEARCLLGNSEIALPDEKVYAHMMYGNPTTGFWDGRDSNGRRTGGMMSHATYRLYQHQPPAEVLASKAEWEAWCDGLKETLMTEFEKSRAVESERVVHSIKLLGGPLDRTRHVLEMPHRIDRLPAKVLLPTSVGRRAWYEKRDGIEYRFERMEVE